MLAAGAKRGLTLRISSSLRAVSLLLEDDGFVERTSGSRNLGCRKCAQAVAGSSYGFLSRLILSGRQTQHCFEVPTRLGEIGIELQRCREVTGRLIPLALQH